MSSYKILYFAIAVFCANLLLGQDFEVPKNYKLEKKEDYKPYEKDVLACIEYLETSSFDPDNEVRLQANAFLLKWITGCPYISINLHGYVMDYTQENKDFLLIFLGGWTKYAIEHPDDVDDFSGNLAGIKSIIKVYKLDHEIEEDDNVEELIKLENDGKLESWLKEKLKSEE